MTQIFSHLTQDQIVALERERLDISYRNPDWKALQQAERDKRMFNAGRYSAGARDKTALKAHLELEKELA